MGSTEVKVSKKMAKENVQNNPSSLAGEVCLSNNEKSATYNLDKSGGVANVEAFEDLLDIIGTLGPWNIMVFILCSLAPCMSALQLITYEFIGATPDHWCRVDDLLEANWTQQQILDFAIPIKNDSTYERCQMYDYDYTSAVKLGFTAAMESLVPKNPKDRNVIPCSAQEFNHTQYESTTTIEFDLVCERRALYSTTQAVSQLGGLVSCAIIGPLNNAFGRRRVSVVCVVLTLLCGLGVAASTSLEVYITLKFLACFSIFSVYTSNFVNSIELCSSSQRSSWGSLFAVPWAIGYMIVPGIAYLIRPWRWLQVAYTLPNLLLLSYFWLLPESPRWLISKGRYEEAFKVLSWAAKVNKRPLPPSESLIISMKKITKTQEEEEPKEDLCGNVFQRIKDVFILIIKPELRKRAIICAFCWFSVSIVYYGISLSSSTYSADPYLFIFFGGLVEMPSYILLWPSIIYLGRKVSLISQYLLCGMCIALISILMITFDNVPVGVLIFLSMSGKLAITATSHLLFIYTAELFPTKYRSVAVGEGSMIARVGSTMSPYVIDLFGAVISWGPSVLFSGLSILAASLALILPETKDDVMNEKSTFDGKRGRRESECQKERGYVNDAYEAP